MRIRIGSPRRFGIFVTVIAAMALVVFLQLGGAVRGAEGCRPTAIGLEATGPASVIVSAGDSLWAIAVRFGPTSTDPRLRVYQLRIFNSLDSAVVRVGQEILLPPAWSERTPERSR